MANTQEGLIQFTVTASDFTSALAGLKPARPRKGEESDLSGRITAAIDRGEVSFGGAAVRFDAKVAAAGAAPLSWALLESLSALARKLGKGEIEVTLQDGAVQMGRSRISSAQVRLVSSEGKQPILPIGASLLTRLSLNRANSNGDLENWGILERCRKAEKEAAAHIDWATTHMKPLGISRRLLEMLVNAAVACHGDASPSDEQILLTAWSNSRRDDEGAAG